MTHLDNITILLLPRKLAKKLQDLNQEILDFDRFRVMIFRRRVTLLSTIKIEKCTPQYLKALRKYNFGGKIAAQAKR
ncbi:unnamed protein product [Paramecium sonneborni]|uniref:Uncharacterized protein n=1 Tax=Paramecium sonneborni TaxID=65129 RepID=A0A8S1RTK5_9CILI|nr:unnamed protein product [Paramecium sonneborni]